MNEINYEVFVKNIGDLAAKKSIPRNKALIDSGVGKDFVTNITKGSTPSIDKIFKLSDYFNVSIDYLLGLDTEPNRNTQLSEDIQELIDLYSNLPERKQGEVKGFIKGLTETNRRSTNDTDNDIIENPRGKFKVAHAAAFGGGTMDILIPADVSYDEINRLIDENEALQRQKENKKVADELKEIIKRNK